MSSERENITTYHIYIKDRCIYHNLKQEEFDETWELLNVMVGLLKTNTPFFGKLKVYTLFSSLCPFSSGCDGNAILETTLDPRALLYIAKIW